MKGDLNQQGILHGPSGNGMANWPQALYMRPELYITKERLCNTTNCLLLQVYSWFQGANTMKGSKPAAQLCARQPIVNPNCSSTHLLQFRLRLSS
jgi:hypothetical protein